MEFLRIDVTRVAFGYHREKPNWARPYANKVVQQQQPKNKSSLPDQREKSHRDTFGLRDFLETIKTILKEVQSE